MTRISLESPVRRFQALAICNALKARVQLGLQVNRVYTPKNMVHTASAFTGKSYTSNKKGITEAHNDLAAILGKDPI